MSNFGVTETSIMNLLPGNTQVCDIGGSVVVADIISIYFNRLLAQLSPTSFEMLARPDREQIIRYSSTPIASATLGLFPLKTGSYVRLFTNPSMYDTSYQQSQVTATIVSASLGTITFETIPAESDLWASYEVDIDLVEVPSLANIIKYGVTGELLMKVTPKDSFGYNLGVTYMKIWDDAIEALKDNDYAIPELRRLTFFNSTTDMPSVISARKHRGT